MTLEYPALPGDVDYLIADDHAVVLRQVEHLEAGRGNRRVLVGQTASNVAVHAEAEETVLYPALVEIGRTEEAESLRVEHAEVNDHLVVITRATPEEYAYEAALAAVIAAVRKHADEQETVSLPDLRFEAGPERMGVLGRRYIDAKRTAPTNAHLHTLDRPCVGQHDPGSGRSPRQGPGQGVGRQAGLSADASGLLDTPGPGGARRLLRAGPVPGRGPHPRRSPEADGSRLSSPTSPGTSTPPGSR